MILLRQIVSFAAVGVSATVTHVAFAWLLIENTILDPYLCNLCGACAAFAISMLGNWALTFRTNRSLLDCAQRYAVVSIVSFVITTAILLFVRYNSWPFSVYALIVLITVPPTTFVLAKLWAFRPLSAGRRIGSTV